MKKATEYVKNVLWLDYSLTLEAIHSLEMIKFNESLLLSLKEIKAKIPCNKHQKSNIKADGLGFFIPIAQSVKSDLHQISIYLCSMESHLYEFLELTDHNVYSGAYVHDKLIFNKLMSFYDENYCSLKKINQLLIASLPTMNKSGILDEHQNVFCRYFRNAKFAQESSPTKKKNMQKFTSVYRFYTYDCATAIYQKKYGAELLNYIITRFKADSFLSVNGVTCFSQMINAFTSNEVAVTQCFENDNFQLVMGHGCSPEINNQFVLHVPRNVFRRFLANNYPADEDALGFGQDEYYESYDELDQFQISLRSINECHSVNKEPKDPLSLVQTCILNELIRLYKLNEKCVSDFRDFVYAFSKSYSIKVYEGLALYVFEHLFELATKYFYGSLDEMYCLLFTFIALSSKDEVYHLVGNKSSSLNDSANSYIFYFYSFYLINKQPNESLDSDRKIMYRDSGNYDVNGAELSDTNKNRWFGLYCGAYGPDVDNFLTCRFRFLREQVYATRTFFKSSCINVSIVISKYDSMSL